MTALPRARSRAEFVALMAMLAAMSAFGIDAMLPAMPAIAADLSPADPNKAQLILSSFILGMGVGTLFTGPLADALGRRPVIIGTILLYCFGALMTWQSQSLGMALAGRLVMGLGAAGPRVVTTAIVRDRHSGAEMARLMSFVMVIFMIVPAVAPSVGAVIIHAAGWRAIFPAFALFGLVALVWFGLRQPETLPPERRRPLTLRALAGAVAEMFSHRIVVLSVLVQMLAFGILFSMLSSVQGVFDLAYGQGEAFPLWFALIAAVSATASLLNARLVGRIGMLPIVRGMLAVQIVLSGLMLVALWLPLPRGVEFAAWMIWCCSVFFQGGLVIGNVNALAMQPVGHIAGLAASVIAAVSTVGSVVLSVPVGLAFDGTALPLAAGILVLAGLALGLTGMMRKR